MAKNSYETVIVFSVQNGEEATKALYERMQNLIEQNGILDSVDEWGTRRLAYPINDETEGFYVLFNYQAEPEFPAELDRVVNITEGILRSLVVKKGE